jgi:ubiquinone/menaquinone biosynthesis C-methylase UbiE
MSNAAQPNPAQLYERYFVPAMFAPWAEILVREARVAAGDHVLDVACGTGIVARTAAPVVGAGGRVAALDMNRAMLDVARNLPSAASLPIEWHEGSALQLPFGPAEFDVVLCQHGLQFFPDRSLAAAEMKRVLRAGGRVAVLVLQELSRHPVFERVMSSLASRLGRPLSDFAVPFSVADPEELKRLFTPLFGSVQVGTVSIQARFPEPGRFVDLAVQSSAAAVPAFAQLAVDDRATLLRDVHAEVDPMLPAFVQGSELGFPMWGHLLVATD